MMLHIKNFGGLCCIVFGSESNITKFVQCILKHAIKFWSDYEEIVNSNSRAPAYIIAAIDKVVQCYLDDCQRIDFSEEESNLKFKWFYTKQQEITLATNCPFTWLPQNIFQLLKHTTKSQQQTTTNNHDNNDNLTTKTQ